MLVQDACEHDKGAEDNGWSGLDVKLGSLNLA